MVFFKARLESFENINRLFNRGFDHIDFLEAARQGRVFFENATVLGESGGTNAFELSTGQSRFEQIRRVQGTAGSRTGTDQSVNFIDEQNRVRFVFERLQHAFETLLEIATVFGAGQQCAHVQRIDL